MQQTIQQLQDSVNVAQATVASLTTARANHQAQSALTDARDVQAINNATDSLTSAQSALSAAQASAGSPQQ